LLPYAALIDVGVILLKNGALMASWFYRGEDEQSMTAIEKTARNERINTGLRKMGSGWMTHHNAVRITARNYCAESGNYFVDPVSEAIDDERRRYFEADGNAYETIYTVTATYMPPKAAQSKVESMMFEEDELEDQEKVPLGEKILVHFRRAIADFEDGLRGVIALERMGEFTLEDEDNNNTTYDEQLALIENCLTGSTRKVAIPHCGMYIDSMVGGIPFVTGTIPKLGEKFIMCVSVDGFPQESYAGMLSILDQLPVENRWSTRFIYLDQHEAQGEIKKYTRKWEQKQRGFKDQIVGKGVGKVNRDAAGMTMDADVANAEASSGYVTFGYYTSTIVLMSEDKELLEESAREIRKSIRDLGFEGRIEDVNTVEAFLGSLPGNGEPNIRRPLIHTRNLVDFLPNAAVYAGREFNPCDFFPEESPPLAYAKTQGSTPFRLNLHVHDVGHTLIFGPTGAGKSVLLGLLAASARRYQGSLVFCFDKGRSMYTMTKAVGGHHYELGESDANSEGGEDYGLSFAPLSMIDDAAEQAWAEDWVVTALRLHGVEPSVDQRKKIHDAMTVIRQSPRERRSMTHFMMNLQDQDVRDAMTYYTNSGKTGNLFDAETDPLHDGLFETFEMEDLLNMGEETSLPLLLYIFRIIERRLKGQPCFIFLDEAWVLLANDAFKGKIFEWLKVLRKANASVVLATQSITDAARSGMMDVLQESCPTKIFLPNVRASDPASRGHYYDLGLNDAQLGLIANATPKREYYVTSPEGSRLVDFAMGPLTLSFVGVSSKDDLKEVKEHEARHGENWPGEWVKTRSKA